MKKPEYRDGTEAPNALKVGEKVLSYMEEISLQTRKAAQPETES